ncbi:MAG: hypothetical protein ACKOAD_05910 [Gammaproteobacteria bacterium]
MLTYDDCIDFCELPAGLNAEMYHQLQEPLALTIALAKMLEARGQGMDYLVGTLQQDILIARNAGAQELTLELETILHKLISSNPDLKHYLH